MRWLFFPPPKLEPVAGLWILLLSSARDIEGRLIKDLNKPVPIAYDHKKTNIA